MKQYGFSLVEILVSLLVVSFAAVSVAGLQKMVIEQNRNNVAHSLVIQLAAEKIELVLLLDSSAAVDALHDTDENVSYGGYSFDLHWLITPLDDSFKAGSDIRDVELQISWSDAKGELQTFTYSEQVNLVLLLNSGGGQSALTAAIIISLLETNDIIYFEPKMGYKKGAFVIYDSELFKAARPHSAGGGHPRDVLEPDDPDTSGWLSYGRVDNPELVNNPDLQTLFIE
ncbi:type IV pilus modification PilV family protein [Psychromonas aquimarina]|uniref:type IV pilus modification PilV family protein n=1 Tax=Psychromonas aquimarina TaxID=444919 RepID=UPI00040AEE14|nr:prepilin-type N-terminal cleavage/methylation domain-containing protein [Psychromonas aquimarina]